jgi:hypothetical protein
MEPEINIESLNIVATYDLTVSKNTNGLCLLCRNNLMEPSTDDYESKRNHNIYVTSGMCDHSFHTTCLKKYHEEGKKENCPNCMTKWTNKEKVNVSKLSV